MLTENRIILVKLESDEGVDSTPTTANDFLAVHNLSISPNLTYNETQGRDVSASPRAGTLGQKFYEITFDYELQVNAASPTIPPCAPLLLASGWDDEEKGPYGKFYPTSPRGLLCTRLRFTAGQAAGVAVGDVITGHVSGATGTVKAVTVHTGSWAGNTAAGVLYLSDVAGDFTNNEGLQVGGVNRASADGTKYHPTVTVYAYFEDILYKLTGCRGNVSFTCAAGVPVIAGVTLTGKYDTPTDSAFPVSVVERGGNPLVAMNSAVKWAGETPVIDTLTFSLNNVIATMPSLAAPHGIDSVQITGRTPELTLNPEATKESEIAWWASSLNAEIQPATYSVTDGTTVVSISFPSAQITNLVPGDRNGVMVYDVTFRPCRTNNSARDDECTIQWA